MLNGTINTVAFLTSIEELCKLHAEAVSEANIWQKNYPEYQRLADNEIMDDLDEALPEVNDGTLAASLFKLSKRIVNSNLKGRAKTTNRDEAWLTELANIEWEKQIVPNANSKAPFHRKWKDAVRKAATFGSVPLITLLVERGDYIGADFIVGQPQDILLEPGKVSDYDSDIFFWNVYYSKLQLKDLIERAKKEKKELGDETQDGVNKWHISELEKLYKEFQEEERQETNDRNSTSGNPKIKGVKLSIVFQRGIDAPFYMIHPGTKVILREWSNPDPTGDVPVHFLYCYQDFENPYGVGIVKLAGGTQNVLDYMRQADVLATQLGFRPPVAIKGTDLTGLDLDSIVYAQDAQWMTGNAAVERQEISNAIYSQLPDRMSMYKTSLNQLIPTGDTSISSGSGDPQYSKTPAGVKFQEQSLSIDDEDFKDNLYMTYEAVAKNMINTHFANMQGHDLRKLSDEDRDLLAKAGLEFPLDENEDPTNELDIMWDEVRANFDFEMDAEQDKIKDDEKKLDGLMRVMELRMSDPMFDQTLMQAGKKLNYGELMGSLISLTTDNDKILEDIVPEDQMAMQQQMEQEAMMAQGGMAEGGMAEGGMPQEGLPEEPIEGEVVEDPIPQLMEAYGVDEATAGFMVEAEGMGYSPEEILETLERRQEV